MIFKEEAQVYNDPSCEMILMSAHPTEDIGIAGMAKCYVHRFRYPDFEPELAPAGGLTPGESEAVAIGSGNDVEDYRKALQNAGQYPFQVTGPIVHVQHWDPTIAASVLVGDIRHAIYNREEQGVSPLLQLCLVSRGDVRIVNANTKRYGQDSVEDFTVPELARTDAELAIALADLGGTANARC